MAGNEVGSAYLTILPTTKGFASNLSRELDGPFNKAGVRAGDQISDGVGKSQGFAAAGGKLGAVFAAGFAAIGVAQIGGAVKDFFVDTIESGSDLNETTSKAGQIFGKSQQKVVDFAKTAASALGQSQQAALDGASTFGIFAKSAGLSESATADFSTEMVSLAGDLASFNNTSPEDAITAIGAALRGESEPIRAYGVLLDDATLKARAMSLGLIQAHVDEVKVAGARQDLATATKKLATVQKQHGVDSEEYAAQVQNVAEKQQALDKAVQGTTDEALTPQQRVLAAHAEILAQTSTQQGDFARTSGELANQQRIATAEFENAKAEIGTALLPVVTDLFKTFSEVGVPALQDLATWFSENKELVSEMAVNAVAGGLLVVEALLGIGSALIRVEVLWISWTQVLLDAWLFLVDSILQGAENAFGWIPGLGPKLDAAHDKFDEFSSKVRFALSSSKAVADDTADAFDSARDSVEGLRQKVLSLNGTTATVFLNAQGNMVTGSAAGGFRAAGGGNIPAFRAGGGPVRAGTPYIVGENEPELFVPDRNGQIYNGNQMAALGGHGGVGLPDRVTLVDSDGSILGHTQVIVGSALATQARKGKNVAAAASLRKIAIGG